MDPGGNEDGLYDITFQVWRPSSLREGCYSLVGENPFYEIDLGSGGLVCQSPEAGEEVRVQPGDVVGFYVVHREGGERGIQIAEDYDNESVWYGVGMDLQSKESWCLHTPGGGTGSPSLQRFTNHAPILSITLGK